MKIVISSRFKLLIIAAIFILPLALAWLMYTGTLKFEPVSTRNLGTLVDPPVPLDWHQARRVNSGSESATAFEDLQEHWVILVRISGLCDAACQERVSLLRQIHLATGRHQYRVRLALLLDGNSKAESIELLESLYDKFNLIIDPSDSLNRTIATVRLTATESANTYLIDPLGNIMMYYTTDSDPNDLKQDLKRLLTWSKLDEQ